MSSHEAAPTATLNAVRAMEQACELTTELLKAGQVEAIAPQTIQQLMSAAVKLYVAKRASGFDFDPVGQEDLTATDVSVTATGLLKAVRLEPFELSWWRRFGQI
jgi:hypothetical protein